MPRRSLLITFSGSDGAGKSTQISLLSNDLKSKGENVDIFWARGGYTSNMQKLKNFIRFIFKKKLPSPGPSIKRSKIISNKLIAWIWINLAILDLIFLWAIVLRIKLFMGNYVICDRFIDDTRLDFESNFPYFQVTKFFLWKILKFICTKPDISFLLYINVDESKKRSILKNEPFPDTEELLSWRLDKYLCKKYFSTNVYKKIETSEDIKTIQNYINIIFQEIKNSRIY